MKKAILKEVQEIRRKFEEYKKTMKSGDAINRLADEFDCSIERIRQIVYLHKVPYESRYKRRNNGKQRIG